MAIQLSPQVRNARLDAIEVSIGPSPILKVFSGTMPAATTNADTGTVLSTVTLPSDWMAAASAGSKALAGNWQDTSADATGTAGYFRIYDSAVTACHLQGTMTATGGGGDMTVTDIAFNAGQDFRITAFTLQDANG
jgi:hypothetical protein